MTLLAKRKVPVVVSRADQAFRSWLERYDLMEFVDPGRFYPTNRHAAAAFRAEAADGTTPDRKQRLCVKG